MAYPYQQYPQQASQQWGAPTGGAAGPQSQWGGPSQQQPQQQWGAPTGGAEGPQSQWGGPQGQAPWGGPSSSYPGQQPTAGGPPGYPTSPAQGQSPPPTQPPSGFQGWFTQLYNQMGPQEMQQVRQWFMSVDRDRSGSITANELANVAIGGIVIGIDIAVKLIRVFDLNKNGNIDFDEYAALHKFLLNMQGLFQQQDKDHNGRLDSNEMASALTAGGFVMGPIAFQSLYRKYNQTGQGISMVEFLAVIAHVAQVRSLFEWRDSQRSGQITLDLASLLEITASI